MGDLNNSIVGIFICGYFGTKETYRNLHLDAKGFIMYEYDQNLDIEVVYSNLKRLVERVLPLIQTPIVMAHSAGGYLVTRLMQDTMINRNTKIVLLEPLLDQPNYGLVMKYVPGFKYLYTPKWMQVPRYALTSLEGIWSTFSIDQWRLHPMIQPVSICKSVVDFEDIVELFQDHGNVRIIYSALDQLATLDPEQLAHLDQVVHKLIVLPVKHEPFNDIPAIQHMFNQALAEVLE